MKAPTLVAVSQATAQQSDTAGAIVWWRLSGAINLSALEREWAARGWRKETMPSAPTPAAALAIAARSLKGPRRLVRPLSKGEGWAVVDESADEETGLAHRTVGTVWLEIEGKVESVRGEGAAMTPPVLAQLQLAYDDARHTVPQAAASAWLARTIDGRMLGVALRDTGGIYFLPRKYAFTYRLLGEALRAASAHVLHSVPSLRSEDALAAILEAITAEAQQAAAAIEARVASGDCGERTLTTQREAVDTLRAKVRTYEELLGRALPELQQKLTDLDTSAALAILAAKESK